MAWANPVVSDLIAAGIESRTNKTADNLTNNNALIRRLKDRGNVKMVTGGTKIFHEIRYNDASTNNVTAYSGYDVVNTTPDSPISAFTFDMKHYAGAVSISDTEKLTNSGKEQMFSLIEERVEICRDRLMNRIDLDLHLDGTAGGGKTLIGLPAMISATPTTGTYAGVDRALWTFARNLSTTSTIVNGAAATAANIQNLINRVCLSLVRQTDKVDIIYAGQTFYELYLSSLQTIQRIADETGSAGSGFTSLKYYGHGAAADVVLGGGIGGNLAANTAYFINSKHVFWRPHKDRNLVTVGGDRQSTNQMAVTRLMGYSAAFTTDGPQFCGIATTA